MCSERVNPLSGRQASRPQDRSCVVGARAAQLLSMLRDIGKVSVRWLRRNGADFVGCGGGRPSSLPPNHPCGASPRGHPARRAWRRCALPGHAPWLRTRPRGGGLQRAGGLARGGSCLSIRPGGRRINGDQRAVHRLYPELTCRHLGNGRARSPTAPRRFSRGDRLPANEGHILVTHGLRMRPRP